MRNLNALHQFLGKTISEISTIGGQTILYFTDGSMIKFTALSVVRGDVYRPGAELEVQVINKG